MKREKKLARPKKEPPRMVVMKIPVKFGRKIEYRELLMNAAHPKFER